MLFRSHIDLNNENDLNVKLWFKKIIFLRKSFNIIIRPHPKTIISNNNILKELANEKFIIDYNSNRKIGDIIKHSALVFCDYGGPVFSTIYLNKSLVLLNLPNTSKYNLNLKTNQSLDITIRQELISLDINSSENEILKKISLSLKNKYKKKIIKVRNKYFGPTKPYSVDQLSDFLIKLIKKN